MAIDPHQLAALLLAGPGAGAPDPEDTPSDLAADPHDTDAPQGHAPLPHDTPTSIEVPASPPAMLKEVLSLVNRYKAVETDEKDKLVAEKISTLIQQLLADAQADQQEKTHGVPTAPVARPGLM